MLWSRIMYMGRILSTSSLIYSTTKCYTRFLARSISEHKSAMLALIHTCSVSSNIPHPDWVLLNWDALSSCIFLHACQIINGWWVTPDRNWDDFCNKHIIYWIYISFLCIHLKYNFVYFDVCQFNRTLWSLCFCWHSLNNDTASKVSLSISYQAFDI